MEDKLQADVYQSIENLRNAGIIVWMLTGDKLETAKCISISTGIKPNDQDFFQIKEILNKEEMQICLETFANNPSFTIIIDGISLNTALNNIDQKYFFKVISQAPSVIYCRCSPTQKTIVTESFY